MSEERLDVHEFLQNDLMIDNICKTKRILGVFEDEIYCYFKGDIADTKSVTYFIEKINNTLPIKKVIVSEMTDDEIQTYLVEYFTKNNISFKFVTDYSDEDQAYMIVICEEDIQREPLLYETDIPKEYLENYGKTLCKKHMAILEELDHDMIKYYKKESFLTKGSCILCKLEERKK
ncbi:hypothetical protein [Anaerofustis butyriciformans]|uniref:hypothetical protein n=1 Tax=Anaerofustis butyriciformans TaxID=3108533 RepID=UPI002E340A42|nr:hypothetical protein [Anaerofustis sp. HA2171]